MRGLGNLGLKDFARRADFSQAEVKLREIRLGWGSRAAEKVPRGTYFSQAEVKFGE